MEKPSLTDSITLDRITEIIEDKIGSWRQTPKEVAAVKQISSSTADSCLLLFWFYQTPKISYGVRFLFGDIVPLREA